MSAALDVIKRADDAAKERNGGGGDGGANGAPPIDVESDAINASGISEAEVTALDLRPRRDGDAPRAEVEEVKLTAPAARTGPNFTTRTRVSSPMWAARRAPRRTGTSRKARDAA